MGVSSNAGKEIEKQQLARQQSIQQGTALIDKAFKGFTPEYYEGVRGATLGTLVPQFERQYRDASKGTALSFANRGTLKSSGAREAGTRLAQDRGLGRILIDNQAEGAVRETKAQVSQAKNTATSQLIASQDPTLAAQQAITGAAGIGAPSPIAPLGQFFNTAATGYLAHQVGKTYNERDPQRVDTSKSLGSNYYTK